MRRADGLLSVAAFVAGFLPGVACTAEVMSGVDEEAGLPYWQVQDQGASVRLVQRLPDQSRGFFMARGFSARHAEIIANSCVFQTVFRNTSDTSQPSPVEYNLREWVVRRNGVESGMKVREDWKTEWAERNAPMPARIAFEWALFPTRQTYEPGDYNWGMSIFDLPPGTTFDLEIVWHQYGEVRTTVVEDIQCAPDIHPEPAS